MPPTLQAVACARIGAYSQLPSGVQVAGPGAMQGGHGVMQRLAADCLAKSESSLSASTLFALTGVGQPHETLPEILPVHWSDCS